MSVSEKLKTGEREKLRGSASPSAFGEWAADVGFFERDLSIGLQDKRFGHVLFEAPLDAAFIESEELAVAAFGDPDAGWGEGGIYLGASRGDFVGFSRYVARSWGRFAPPGEPAGKSQGAPLRSIWPPRTQRQAARQRWRQRPGYA
jgi:hypothetical protein